MKQFPLTIIVTVLLVGCGKAQHSTGDKPAERVAEVTQPAASSKPLSEADSALMDAANKGNIEAVKQHLAAGADVNAKGNNGETPLDWAIRGKHTEIADLLRKHGAKTAEELKAEGK